MFIVFVGIVDADTVVNVKVDFPQTGFVTVTATVLRWKNVWLLVTGRRVEIPLIALMVCLTTVQYKFTYRSSVFLTIIA